MKRAIAVFLAFLLLLSQAAYAFADADTAAEKNSETDTLQLTTRYVDENLYDGDWYTICNAIWMYIPVEGWTDLPDLAQEAGLLLLYSAEDNSKLFTVYEIDAETVSAWDLNGMEGLAQTMVDGGYEDAEVVNVNNIPAVMYTDINNNALMLLCSETGGGLLCIGFAPVSSEEYFPEILNMICSITPIEEQTEETN